MAEKLKKPHNEDYTSGISSTALKPMAAVIYAAAANQDDKMMQYVGSTLLNRLESGRKEFGAENGNISEVINHPNAYYEKDSQLYKDFISGQFKDEASKKRGLAASSIAAALNRGTLDRMPGEFWHSDDEIARNKKAGKKVFDYNKVKDLGRIGTKGQFHMFGY